MQCIYKLLRNVLLRLAILWAPVQSYSCKGMRQDSCDGKLVNYCSYTMVF